MSHLAVTEAPAPRPLRRRRAPRSTALIALALIGFGVVGCSAGGGSSADEAGEPQSAVGGSAGRDDAEVADADSDEPRAVIIDGTMVIVVDDVTEATGTAIAVVESAEGRIDGRREYSGGDGGSAYSTMVLRIPADSLDDAIAELRALGEVESVETATTDVTSEVDDVDSRIASLRSTIARLQTFQAEATSVSDLLTIEQEIATRQAELESSLTRQAEYADQVSFSTLTLTLQSEPAPFQPEATGPDSFWSGLAVGWGSLMTFLGGLAIVLGVALPWLVGIGLLTAAIILIVRWISRRRARRQAPAPAQPMTAMGKDDATAPVGVGGMPPTP
jgi:hypothetical protein